MNNAYLLIGGNEGERLGYLEKASDLISASLGEIINKSSIYETAAWGKPDQPNFLNQVLLVKTNSNAIALMSKILEIEGKMGRIRNEKYGQRTIDIDILFFNDEIINLPELKIPHPEIQRRRFVLAPMDEVAPELIHPVLQKSIRELLSECEDKLDVKKI